MAMWAKTCESLSTISADTILNGIDIEIRFDSVGDVSFVTGPSLGFLIEPSDGRYKQQIV